MTKTITETIKPDYDLILNTLNVDTAISPRLFTAGKILKLIRKGEVVSMTILKDEKAEIMELIVPEHAPIVKREISKANLPLGLLVGAIVRNEEVIIPRGGDRIMPNDRLILFVKSEISSKVDNYFANIKSSNS